MSNEMKNKKRPVVFMTGAGGGMGSESFKQMLPDIGKKYDLIVFDRDTEKIITFLTLIREQRD